MRLRPSRTRYFVCFHHTESSVQIVHMSIYVHTLWVGLLAPKLGGSHALFAKRNAEARQEGQVAKSGRTHPRGGGRRAQTQGTSLAARGGRGLIYRAHALKHPAITLRGKQRKQYPSLPLSPLSLYTSYGNSRELNMPCLMRDSICSIFLLAASL